MKHEAKSDSDKKKNTMAKAKSNLYLILDILPGASHNDILHAYNRAKMTYTAGSLASYSLIEDDSGESILSDIEKAFEVLGHPSRRREYDIEMGFNTWADESSPKSGGPVLPSILSKEHRESDSETSAPAAKAPPTKAKLEVLSAPVTQFEPNPEFEKKIEECTQIDGAFLRAVRIYRRMTPEQLANRCKLSAAHVLSLEEEESGKLHHPTYLRGHVVMICQALELPNPDTLAKAFVARMLAEGKTSKNIF